MKFKHGSIWTINMKNRNMEKNMENIMNAWVYKF